MPRGQPSRASLGIVSIATNVYLRYWQDLARSVDQHVRVFDPVTMHVFTDQTQQAEDFARSLQNVSVRVHEVPAMRWPEATLFRYKIFSENADELSERVLLYLDADTLVKQDFEPELPQLIAESGIVLVEQAGSWRPKSWRNLLRFFVLHPGAIFQDVRKLLVEGGRGTWEKRVESTAYVARSERKNYVTGAVWMGTRDAFLEMVSELAARVDIDWRKEIIAVWHDESHLNWWNARYHPTLADPRYYFFPGQRHLDELPNIIQLIAKDEITR